MSSDKKHKTVCLNMIVRNESHVIVDTLTKLCKKINFDYWVVSDTGSDDGTPEIITNFFNERGIQGEVFYDTWKDFGHNRSLALEHAYNKSDYLLIFDADDELCGDFVMPELKDDGYYFKLGSEDMTYCRVLLVNNRKLWRFCGVLHEYIEYVNYQQEEPVLTMIEGKYYVVSGKSGHRSKNPNKYADDADILEKAFYVAKEANDHLHVRYAFYCANSCFDSRQYERAIKWYKTTLEIGHWNQEKYMACLKIYKSYEYLDQKENGFYYLVESFKHDKGRVECLHILVVHYCVNGMDDVAYNYYLNCKPHYETEYLKTKSLSHKLFADVSAFSFFLPYYMIIVSERTKHYETGIAMYRIIFTKKHKMFDKWWLDNLLFNFQFFTEHVDKSDTSFFKEFESYLHFLKQNGVKLYEIEDILEKYDEYVDMSPFFVSSKPNLLIYTGYSNHKWNSETAKEYALGGSEMAVIHLSTCLSKHYTVYVAGGVKSEKVDTVRYVGFDGVEGLLKKKHFKAIIISRYLHFLEFHTYASADKIILWAHDTRLLDYGTNLKDKDIIDKWNNKINGCVCLSEWQIELYKDCYPQLNGKVTMIKNGIPVELFETINHKIKNRFIYTSCSERGLKILLDLWGQITERLPDAELFISSYNDFPKNDEDKEMKEMIEKYDNIKHLGKLNTNELYNLMSGAEYWLYPNTFPETSCITALEMLMSEVICLYYPNAGLVNTIGEYGVVVEKGNEIDTLLSLKQEDKEILKQKGREYAKQCSWENRSLQWIELINKPIPPPVEKRKINWEALENMNKYN